MDVFNRPPTISEDTLFYELYPPSSMIDKASVTTLAVVMQEFAKSLLPDMQWHRDAFELKVNKMPDQEGYRLEGRMRVGDCVDDEWCTVWILRELSAKWDIVIRIYDTDGEFLLIEAAEQLPPWISPANAVNRVWIYDSHVHLVPLKHISSSASKASYKRNLTESRISDEGMMELEDFISAQDAVEIVRDTTEETKVSPQVEQAVWRRTSSYPEAARSHIHHTFAVVPIDIARALSVRPALVQKAVETFYTRDALQLRAAHRMSRFPPEPSVRTTIKITRTAYAQLTGQQFYPPKVFARVRETEGTPAWRWQDLGMKIACGFEMLYQESKGRTSTVFSADAKSSAAAARKEALRHNPDYRKYTENLQKSGYFRNEIEGSRLWTELEDKAAAAFVEVRHDDDATRLSFASQVDVAAASADEELPNRPEDPDDWLHIEVHDFDTLLQDKLRGEQGLLQDDMDDTKREDIIANEQASKLKKLADKVEEFIEGDGDLEGARFADELLSDEESSDDDEDQSESEDADMTYASDSDSGEQRQAAMDALVPGIKPSEYGQMPPSFHRHSQRVARDSAVEGAAASSTSQIRTPSVRPPLLSRDKYEGVDSDDETDEESEEERESDDERPQLVGDVDVDMEEEQEEFLEFARHALGVTDEQWQEIVQERKGRGAFVPESSIKGSKFQNQEYPAFTSKPLRPDREQSDAGPNLDSFEAVMRAMDSELARSRSSVEVPTASEFASTVKGKGKQTASAEDSGIDIEAAMDAELKENLQRSTDEDDENVGLNGDTDVDYNMIKNFLESFKSQAGLSGPVSNLAGRLQSGWAFPSDSS